MLKNLYLIVGHSGSGKSTVANELSRRYGYITLASYTDRPKRSEDETGHVFVTTEEFNNLGEMLAYTMFNGHQYGATQELVDHSDLYLIDPDGIRFMKERYHSDRPVRIIGLSVPKDELVKRMRARGDSMDMIQSRLKNDDVKFEGMDDLCDVIVRNDNLEDTLETVQALINRYEGIKNPALQHIGIKDYDMLIGGVIPEKQCSLINLNKVSEEEANRIISAGEYSPYVLSIPFQQWLGVFKDENVYAPPKPRLFVDMDGTLCKWRVINQEEDLFTKGWFRDMEPVQNVVDAVNMIRAKNDVEVFIMTAVMEGSPYIKGEKKEWVEKYLPGIPEDHVLFTPCGKHKHEFAPGGIVRTDTLLDDYSWNLHDWAKHGIAVKIKTPFNGTKGTWTGPVVFDSMAPAEIVAALERLWEPETK